MPSSIAFLFVDTGGLVPQSRNKTIYVRVTVAITQTSGQATIQLYACRSVDGLTAIGAATSQLTTAQVKVGTAQNFGASGTTIPAGLYRISPAALAELQWPDAMIGLEFSFPGAPSTGAFQPYLESEP